jgi:hypothetical protein
MFASSFPKTTPHKRQKAVLPITLAGKVDGWGMIQGSVRQGGFATPPTVQNGMPQI